MHDITMKFQNAEKIRTKETDNKQVKFFQNELAKLVSKERKRKRVGSELDHIHELGTKI